MKQAAKWTGNVLLGLVILGLIFFLVSPHLFGFEFFTVISGSMSPTIPMGSVVLVKPVEVSEVQVGDIIAFVPRGEESRTVVHRVTEVVADKGSPCFQTKGDANEDPDKYTAPSEHLQGRVFFHIPYLGYISHYARTPLGFMLLVAVPGGLIILAEIISVVAGVRSAREKGVPAGSPVLGLKRVGQRWQLAEQREPTAPSSQPSPKPEIKPERSAADVKISEERDEIAAEASRIAQQTVAKIRKEEGSQQKEQRLAEVAQKY